MAKSCCKKCERKKQVALAKGTTPNVECCNNQKSETNNETDSNLRS